MQINNIARTGDMDTIKILATPMASSIHRASTLHHLLLQVTSLAQMQEQLNHLAGQFGMGAPTGGGGRSFDGPLHNPQADPGSVAAQIAQRQQALNSASSKSHPPISPGAGQSNTTNLINSQLVELKNDLAGVRQHVSKSVSSTPPATQTKIDRIASAIQQLQNHSNTADGDFERLAGELEQICKSMKQDLQSTVRDEIKAGQSQQSGDLISRLDALGRDIRQQLESGSINKGADDISSKLDNLTRSP